LLLPHDWHPRPGDSQPERPQRADVYLVAAGDNPDRLRSEAAFSMLCGSSPIPASSGKTVRHRLNRGGNRQANAALHRIVLVRLRWHQPTREYVDRRSQEGKTKREIIRCLKRYLAREIYTALTQNRRNEPRPGGLTSIGALPDNVQNSVLPGNESFPACIRVLKPFTRVGGGDLRPRHHGPGLARLSRKPPSEAK